MSLLSDAQRTEALIRTNQILDNAGMGNLHNHGVAQLAPVILQDILDEIEHKLANGEPI